MSKIITDKMMNFYAGWYDKTKEEIDYDIRSCVEKCEEAKKLLSKNDIGVINSVLEIGCGYGCNLAEIVKYTQAGLGIGQDISKEAIDFAQRHYANEKIKYLHIGSLDIKETVAQICKIRQQKFDLAILFDVLEHIPRPKEFVGQIASIAKCFLIILPIDNTIFNDYIMKKSYPSSLHPDGHLREFNVNNVHQFVVSLGLAPLAFDFHIWSLDDMYPLRKRPLTMREIISRRCLRIMNGIARNILPKRIFLRMIGAGFFVCMATWSPEYVLE